MIVRHNNRPASDIECKIESMFDVYASTNAPSVIVQRARLGCVVLTETVGRGSTSDPVAEYNSAVAARKDLWVPACGGKERPFEVHGTRYLYVYNPALGHHAFLNLDTDRIMPPGTLPY